MLVNCQTGRAVPVVELAARLRGLGPPCDLVGGGVVYTPLLDIPDAYARGGFISLHDNRFL